MQFKVGDKVQCSRKEKINGEVTHISRDSGREYPVTVDFPAQGNDKDPETDTYTAEGKLYTSDSEPCLTIMEPPQPEVNEELEAFLNPPLSAENVNIEPPKTEAGALNYKNDGPQTADRDLNGQIEDLEIEVNSIREEIKAAIVGKVSYLYIVQLAERLASVEPNLLRKKAQAEVVMLMGTF